MEIDNLKMMNGIKGYKTILYIHLVIGKFIKMNKKNFELVKNLKSLKMYNTINSTKLIIIFF